MAEMVVFDYGRTLFDRETDDFFPDVVFVISTLSKKYRLSIVSVSRIEEEEERLNALRKIGILDHFEEILFTASGEEKSRKYDELLQRVGLNAAQVVIVDDYIIRGIAWGNKSGATTIWFQNGKFADLKPDHRTGQPNYTIHSFSELIEILN